MQTVAESENGVWIPIKDLTTALFSVQKLEILDKPQIQQYSFMQKLITIGGMLFPEICLSGFDYLANHYLPV